MGLGLHKFSGGGMDRRRGLIKASCTASEGSAQHDSEQSPGKSGNRTNQVLGLQMDDYGVYQALVAVQFDVAGYKATVRSFETFEVLKRRKSA